MIDWCRCLFDRPFVLTAAPVSRCSGEKNGMWRSRSGSFETESFFESRKFSKLPDDDEMFDEREKIGQGLLQPSLGFPRRDSNPDVDDLGPLYSSSVLSVHLPLKSVEAAENASSRALQRLLR